jgi:hypothetical protein
MNANNTQDTSNTQHIMEQALASHIGCEWSELEPCRHDFYGLDSFSYGREEWAIGSDDDAQEAVTESIKQVLWAFRPSFILGCCGLPLELDEAIQAWQEKECENCNDAIEQMIDRTCELDEFVRQALMSDGRGHFLSSYDGEEVELKTEAGTFYAYRIN